MTGDMVPGTLVFGERGRRLEEYVCGRCGIERVSQRKRKRDALGRLLPMFCKDCTPWVKADERMREGRETA